MAKLHYFMIKTISILCFISGTFAILEIYYPIWTAFSMLLGGGLDPSTRLNFNINLAFNIITGITSIILLIAGWKLFSLKKSGFYFFISAALITLASGLTSLNIMKMETTIISTPPSSFSILLISLINLIPAAYLAYYFFYRAKKITDTSISNQPIISNCEGLIPENKLHYYTIKIAAILSSFIGISFVYKGGTILALFILYLSPGANLSGLSNLNVVIFYSALVFIIGITQLIASWKIFFFKENGFYLFITGSILLLIARLVGYLDVDALTTPTVWAFRLLPYLILISSYFIIYLIIARKNLSQSFKKLANNELTNYINNQRQAGFSDEQIKKELIGSGWQESDINKRFNYVAKQSMLPSKKLTLIIATMFLTWAGGAVTFFYLANQTTDEPSSQAQVKENASNIKNDAFIEIGKEYSQIGSLTEINGKLAYIAKKYVPEGIKSKGSVIFYDGQEMNNNYDDINSLAEINGKLAYIAKRDEKEFIVYDGQEIGKEYDGVAFPVEEINEKLTYVAEINGKLTYIAEKNGRTFIVYDGQEIGKEYGNVNSPTEINGKLAFVVYEIQKYTPGEKQPETKSFIVYDGQEIGKEYYKIDSLTEINGKLAYRATKNVNAGSEGSGWFIVYDSEEIGKEYYNVNSFTEINGKLTYIAKKNGRTFIIYDGQEISKEYYNVDSFTEIDGKLAYAVRGIEETKTFIVYDGQEIGKEYYDVYSFREINGKLAYETQEKASTKHFIVYDGKEIGKEYDNINSFTEINNKLAFMTRTKDGKGFIVMEK